MNAGRLAEIEHLLGHPLLRNVNCRPIAGELLSALKESRDKLAAKDESYRELFESNQELGAALVKVGAQVAKLREALDTAVNYNFTAGFAAQARALLKETADGE